MIFDSSAFLLPEENEVFSASASLSGGPSPAVITSGLGFVNKRQKLVDTTDELGKRLEHMRRKGKKDDKKRKAEEEREGAMSGHGVILEGDDEEELLSLRRRSKADKERKKEEEKPSSSSVSLISKTKVQKEASSLPVAPPLPPPAEMPSEGDGFKRKRKKTRSKQKNFLRDMRKESDRPTHLREGGTGGRELTKVKEEDHMAIGMC